MKCIELLSLVIVIVGLLYHGHIDDNFDAYFAAAIDSVVAIKARAGTCAVVTNALSCAVDLTDGVLPTDLHSIVVDGTVPTVQLVLRRVRIVR